MQAPEQAAKQADGPAAPAHIVRVQGLSLGVDAQQLQQHAARAFGHVLAADVDPSQSGAPARAGTVVFASLDAAVRAAAHWQGVCELGEAVAAQLSVPLQQLASQQQPQQLQQREQQQAQQAQQQEQQPVQQQQEGDASCPAMPRPPVRRRPTSKPAIVVRGLLPTTTAETLYSVFGSVGSIKRLRLVSDEYGRSAGVAFITFHTTEAARRGLQLGARIMVDGQRPTVGPAHREVDPAEPAQQPQQPQQAQQAAIDTPAPRPVRVQQHAKQQSLQRPSQKLLQQALDPGPDEQCMQRRGSFDSLPASGGSWEAQLHRAGSSPALSGLGTAPSSPGGSLGMMSGSGGEASSTHTLFVRPLAPEVDEAALRDLFGGHAVVLFTRILRSLDGSSRGCGFVRFAEPAQAQLALQALNGVQLSGRTLRLSWARQRQSLRSPSPSPSLEAGSRPRAFGASSSADLSPTVARLAPGGAMGMFPMMAASPGYAGTPVMVSPVYWSTGGVYAGHAVPAVAQARLPPGSPIHASTLPGSPVLGSPFQFAQPVAGFAPLPPAALPLPAIPLDAGSPPPGWASQQAQWPPHWQPMPQLASAGGGGGMPRPPGSFQVEQQHGGTNWQWQAQGQQPGLNFLWDGTTLPRTAAGGGAANAVAQTPCTTPAPGGHSSPSSGSEASVGLAVSAAHASIGSARGGPSPRQGAGQQPIAGSSPPLGSSTPDGTSGDEGALLQFSSGGTSAQPSSSGGTSAQPSSSQLPAFEAEEQLQPAGPLGAAVAQDAPAKDDDAEAAAGSLDRLHI